MNVSFLRNLTDQEFLKHVEPSTDLEKMLAERMEFPLVDPGELERMEDANSSLEDQVSELESKQEELEETMEALKDYAKSLHAALALVEPENELLTDDDFELLK